MANIAVSTNATWVRPGTEKQIQPCSHMTITGCRRLRRRLITQRAPSKLEAAITGISRGLQPTTFCAAIIQFQKPMASLSRPYHIEVDRVIHRDTLQPQSLESEDIF